MAVLLMKPTFVTKPVNAMGGIVAVSGRLAVGDGLGREEGETQPPQACADISTAQPMRGRVDGDEGASDSELSCSSLPSSPSSLAHTTTNHALVAVAGVAHTASTPLLPLPLSP